MRDFRVIIGLSAVLALSLAEPHPAAAQTTCTETSAAITGIDPSTLGTNPDLTGLVTDCTTLLGLMDELRGTATLNWAENLGMDQWDGVQAISPSNAPRVVYLYFFRGSLSGTIPAALGTSKS